MHFHEERNDELRAMAREFIQVNLQKDPDASPFEWSFDWAFHEKFCRWLYGTAIHLGQEMIETVAEELTSAGIEIRTWLPSSLVADIIEIAGSDEQRSGIVRRIRDGEALACLGYSEPDSGSDVASARTRAIRDSDTWVINGEKMFTSNADIATHVFLLTRSNDQVPKHEGLTMFIVPIETAGVEVRPVQTLRGHPTFMTVYQDVRVPDTARVGDVDAGWRVMRTALDLEHGAGQKRADPGPSHHVRNLRRLYDEALSWARSSPTGSRADLGSSREVVARLAIAVEVARLLCARNDIAHTRPGVGNGSKLYATEAYSRFSGEVVDIVGAEGLLDYRDPESPNSGWIEYIFRDAPVWSIAGGSSEVQRDIIAQRRLGLPRASRRPDAPVSTPDKGGSGGL